MSQKEEVAEGEIEEDTQADSYKVAKKVAIGDLMKMDEEDEAMKKYKASLLGSAAKEVYAPKDDPRRVVILELRVTCEGRPKGDIVYKLETKENIEKMKETPFILKESCNYRITLSFRVQHEIVSGLKYLNVITRGGIKVGKDETMIGSFAPLKEPYTQNFPRIGWEEAPSGMLARGKYKAKSSFIDDDKQNHLEFEYAFGIYHVD